MPRCPQDRGLALVGDANGRQIARFDPSPGQRRAGDLKLTGPDLARVMLHPPGLGENLLKLLLCGGADSASMLKDNRPGTRCPLICARIAEKAAQSFTCGDHQGCTRGLLETVRTPGQFV